MKRHPKKPNNRNFKIATIVVLAVVLGGYYGLFGRYTSGTLSNDVNDDRILNRQMVDQNILEKYRALATAAAPTPNPIRYPRIGIDARGICIREESRLPCVWGQAPDSRTPLAEISKVYIEQFIRGYRDAGGNLAWEIHFVVIVVPCESDWQLDPPGYYLGLAQFDPWTWEAAGGGDYTDPYLQGHHVAVWSNRVDPASKGGWLGTWYGCD